MKPFRSLDDVSQPREHNFGWNGSTAGAASIVGMHTDVVSERSGSQRCV
jgi:hypothetical protein